MKNSLSCWYQEVSKLLLAILMALGAIGCVIGGFTVMPILGYFIAVPFALASFYFFKAHLNKQCEIEANDKK